MHIIIFSLLISSIVCQQDTSAPEECSEPESLVSKIVNSLSFRLTSALDNKESNLFFSPFCLSVTLSMAYLGARGSTAREMEKVLGYPELRDDDSTSSVHQAMHEMLFSLENHTEEYSLLVANALFVQNGYDILPSYIASLKSNYTANVQTANFAGDGIGVVDEINRWVSDHTQGKIDNLLQQPLDPMTVMVLLNAIYFKGFWKEPFNEKLTKLRSFYKLDGTTKDVSFMQFQRRVNYFEDDITDYRFLELDYKGDHISMIIMLPNGRYTIPELEVSYSLLCRVRAYLVPTKVTALIPMFRVEYDRELSNIMQGLGVKELFDERKANLTGIRTQNDLYASKLLHKAVIEVNEQGTEAAAVGGMTFTARSGYARITVFKANHPFLFCILDKRSGTILFMGRVTDP